MITKTLLCLAALAAGAATSMAQSNVYSLNVVGYINVTIPAGQYSMIANQLNTTNNTLASLIPTAPDGTVFYKYSGSGYTISTYDELTPGWLPDGNSTLNPGEGGFILNKSASPLTITFVGEVMQGTLTNSLPTGYAIRSSIVPQAGTLTTLGLDSTVVEDGDNLYVYNNGYTIYNYDALTPGWLPSEPTINVGQSFFYLKPPTSTKHTWTRTFTVQ